jgi:hypothetical protein
MAEALVAAGRAGEAVPLAELYVQLARGVTSKGELAWALRAYADAVIRSESSDASAAGPALDECVALASELGMRPLHAHALLTRGRLLHRLGRAEEARATLAEAAERFGALEMTSWVAACAAGGGRPV